MAFKPDNSKHSKMCRRNGGYWDGVADRERNRLARWFKGAAKNHGHFDPVYAEGYELGVFGGEAPEGAIIHGTAK